MTREVRKAAYAALPKGQVDAVAAMSPPCRTVAICAAMYPDIRRFLNSTPSLRTYLVGQNIASWNQLAGWLREIAALREAA